MLRTFSKSARLFKVDRKASACNINISSLPSICTSYLECYFYCWYGSRLPIALCSNFPSSINRHRVNAAMNVAAHPPCCFPTSLTTSDIRSIASRPNSPIQQCSLVVAFPSGAANALSPAAVYTSFLGGRRDTWPRRVLLQGSHLQSGGP